MLNTPVCYSSTSAYYVGGKDREHESARMGTGVCIRKSDSKTCDGYYCCGLVRLIVSTEIPTPYFKMSRFRPSQCIQHLIVFRTNINSKATKKSKREITGRTAWISCPINTY